MRAVTIGRFRWDERDRTDVEIVGVRDRRRWPVQRAQFAGGGVSARSVTLELCWARRYGNSRQRRFTRMCGALCFESRPEMAFRIGCPQTAQFGRPQRTPAPNVSCESMESTTRAEGPSARRPDFSRGQFFRPVYFAAGCERANRSLSAAQTCAPVPCACTTSHRARS